MFLDRSLKYKFPCFVILSRKLFGILSLLFFVFSQGCTTSSQGSSVSVPPSPKEDNSYAPVLAKWTRQANVISRFQSQVKVNAVIFTEDFRQAFMRRVNLLKGTKSHGIDDLTSDKLGFFISIYTPEYAYMNLEDLKLWNIEVHYGSKVLTPSLVKNLREKSWFEPYFPFIDKWTSEYLLVFDVKDATTLQENNFIAPDSVSLVLKSALAGVELTWK